MSKWLVQLKGDAFDLEEYVKWFPSGSAYAKAIDDETYLAGSSFDCLETSHEVYEKAVEVLEEFSSIIILLWSCLRPPSIGHVVYVNSDGSHSRHVFLKAEGSVVRSKVGVVLATGNSPAKPQPTRAQQLLEASRTDRRLQLVTAIWASPVRTWPRLYRLLEEIEAYLGKEVHAAGLCTRAERVRFTRSANTAEIAGDDARHASGKFEPPEYPMTLGEATTFISNLIVNTLQQLHKP